MIKCNQCSVAPSAGPYFRTSCRHLLCDKCAKDAFTSHCYCPICNTQLRPQDVIEFLAGVPPIGMHETIFQIAFQDVAFEAVVDNSNKVMQCATELMAFVQSQLLMELQKESSVRHQLEAGHESYKNESVRMCSVVMCPSSNKFLVLLRSPKPCIRCASKAQCSHSAFKFWSSKWSPEIKS
jgi:hypothetical protein